MNNNYNNQNSNQDGSFQPLFSNDFQNNFNSQPQTAASSGIPIANETQADVPPELGPINNLSDATTSSAPTLDVLNPSFTMPEVNNLNGTVVSNASDQTNTLSNNLSQPANVSETPFNFPSTNPVINNQEPVNNNYGSVLPAASLNPDNFNNNYQVPNNIQNAQVSEPFTPAADFDYSQPVNDIFNMNNNIKNDDVSSVSSSPQPEVASSPLVTPQSDVTEHPVEEEPSSNNNDADETTSVSDDAKESLPIASNADYTIEDESLTKTPQNEKMDLDFEDVSSDNNNETLQDEESNVTKTNMSDETFSKCASEIKQKIDELKQKGFKIDFEEFDFEEMYQLVIKINK